eukprot:TRINITY_DN9292_c0_g5_i1.p1 TRINITY_DN9292_c0_g5~~TRINITY_DN9292_c0_g5_i1.p1  ORF type:complete len:613 (+),score=35.22 TRINITY_DN9292_c0_g5_i1:198-1841(+)
MANSVRAVASTPDLRAKSKRFSVAERGAFGRRPFERRIGGDARNVLRRVSSSSLPCCSTAAVATSRPQLPQLSSASGVHAARVDAPMASLPGAENGCLTGRILSENGSGAQAAIERLLPVNCPPPVSRSSSKCPVASTTFPKQALVRYRTRLLDRCRSLHDVRLRLARHCSLDKVYGPGELRILLARLDEDACDEFFVAAGTEWPKGVTPKDFLHCLVTSSSEALLWELRCRLLAAGIWPRKVTDAMRLLRDLLHRDDSTTSVLTTQSRSCSKESACSVSDDKQDCNLMGDPAIMLSRSSWLHVADRLGLTQREARRIYRVFAGNNKENHLNLRSMLEEVHATVSPHMSLCRFGEQILGRYGTLREAFRSVCIDLRPMTRNKFVDLASTVDVDERHAFRMWSVLLSGLNEVGRTDGDAAMRDVHSGEKDGGDGDGISFQENGEHAVLSEDAFVARMLRWKPSNALDDLRDKLVACCGSVAECRREFKARGLAGGAALSPKRLRDGLEAVGAKHCDSDIILAAARGTCGEVTLDDVLEGIQASTKGAR